MSRTRALIAASLVWALPAAVGCTRPQPSAPPAASGTPGHDMMASGMPSGMPGHDMMASGSPHADHPMASGSPHVHADYRLALDVPPLKAGQPARRSWRVPRSRADAEGLESHRPLRRSPFRSGFLAG